MISNLISALDQYWEVENRPKSSLQHKDEEYLLPLRTSNWIVITITIFIFTITALFVGGGMLS